MIRTVITIELTDGENLANAIRALGFGWPSNQERPTPRDVPKAQEWSDTIVVDTSKPEGAAIVAAAHAETKRVQKELDTPLYPKTTAMDGDRERGKAGPGHRRRTNEQIKADDAYFAAHPQPAPLAPGSDEPMISTGEERISPEDAADEAAETAARAGEKLTIEDLRAAVGRYTEAFGAKASIDNIRTIIGKPMIEVAPEDIAAAIARVEAATRGQTVDMTVLTETAPIPESALADKPTEPVHATKADVVEAIMAYGKKYDGVSDDPKKMPCTTEDMPKIFVAAFGAGVVGLKTAPQTPEGYGKAMTAVYAAVRDNPFKRTAK